MSNGKVPATIKPTNGTKVSIEDTPAQRGWFWPDEARQVLAEIYQQHGHILFTDVRKWGSVHRKSREDRAQKSATTMAHE